MEARDKAAAAKAENQKKEEHKSKKKLEKKRRDEKMHEKEKASAKVKAQVDKEAKVREEREIEMRGRMNEIEKRVAQLGRVIRGSEVVAVTEGIRQAGDGGLDAQVQSCLDAGSWAECRRGLYRLTEETQCDKTQCHGAEEQEERERGVRLIELLLRRNARKERRYMRGKLVLVWRENRATSIVIQQEEESRRAAVELERFQEFRRFQESRRADEAAAALASARRPERRLAEDGGWYTLEEFRRFYGGLKYGMFWNQAHVPVQH